MSLIALELHGSIYLRKLPTLIINIFFTTFRFAFSGSNPQKALFVFEKVFPFFVLEWNIAHSLLFSLAQPILAE